MNILHELEAYLQYAAQPSHKLVRSIDRRRSQMLSGLALVIALLLLIQNTLMIWTHSPTASYSWVGWGMFVLLVVVYLMSRTTAYQIAAGLMIGGLIFFISLQAITNEIASSSSSNSFLWLIFPVLLTGLLMRARTVVIVTTAIVVGLLALYLFADAVRLDESLAQAIGLIVTIGVLAAVFSRIYAQSYVLVENQAKQLHLVNSQLEGKIDVFTQELQLSNQRLIAEMEERARVSEAAMKVQHMKNLGMLARGVAHEFNNKLSAILLQSALVQSRLEVEHPAHKHVDSVIKAAESSALLTSKLLIYANGNRAMRIKRVGICQEIIEMNGLLKQVVSKKIALDMHIKPECDVMGDQTQLQQLIMSLVISVVEIILPDYGQIKLEVNEAEIDLDQHHDEDDEYNYIGEMRPQSGRYITLSVMHNKVGVDQETLKESGHGLSLSAILGTIRAHDGAFRARQMPGGGSMFMVLLPAAHENDAMKSIVINDQCNTVARDK